MHCDPFLEGQIEPMLRAMGNARDRALFALGLATGLRISELLAIRRRDVLDDSGELRRRIVSYHTKGDKKRVVPVNELAVPYLRTWLTVQEARGLCGGAVPVFSYGRGRPIDRTHVWRLIRGAARRSGAVPAWGGSFGTHSMRKTYARAQYLYWEGRRAAGEKIEPLLKCQEALGHADIRATTHYLRFMLGDTEEGTLALYPELRNRQHN
jgi:integrase